MSETRKPQPECRLCGQPVAPTKRYTLTVNDRKFLQSMRIKADDGTEPKQ